MSLLKGIYDKIAQFVFDDQIVSPYTPTLSDYMEIAEPTSIYVDGGEAYFASKKYMSVSDFITEIGGGDGGASNHVMGMTFNNHFTNAFFNSGAYSIFQWKMTATTLGTAYPIVTNDKIPTTDGYKYGLVIPYNCVIRNLAVTTSVSNSGTTVTLPVTFTIYKTPVDSQTSSATTQSLTIPSTATVQGIHYTNGAEVELTAGDSIFLYVNSTLANLFTPKIGSLTFQIYVPAP
jgi:hypothetical protein